MLHLVFCRNTRPYWKAVTNFLTNVLGTPQEKFIDRLIIFNTARGAVISPEACAFVRHAFNGFYKDFAMVDTHHKPFDWRKTFNGAMFSYQRAVFAWAESIKVFTTHRRYTRQTRQVPEDTLHRFPKLVTFTGNGLAYHLTSEFKKAVHDAAEAVKRP